MPRGRIALAPGRPVGRPRVGVGRGRAAKPAGPGRGPAPLPWDAPAESSVQRLGLERNNALSGLAGDARYEEEKSGFGAGASNPYSDVAQLGRQRDIGLRGNLNSAGNQLYAGSTVRKARGVQRGYNEGFNNLQQQFNRNQELRARDKQGAETDYQAGVDQAREGALDRAIAQAPEPAALPGPGAGPGAPAGRRPAARGRVAVAPAVPVKRGRGKR